MKKIIFCLIILIFVSTIAYAEDVIFPQGWIELGGTVNPGGFYDPPYCAACLTEQGPCIGSDTRHPCTSITSIHLVQNGKIVTATCHFTDNSYVPEEGVGTEVWIIDNCNLTSEDLTLSGGTGRIIRAANLEYDPEVDAFIGGKATIRCVFFLPAD
jgi:hypothetical protein